MNDVASIDWRAVPLMPLRPSRMPASSMAGRFRTLGNVSTMSTSLDGRERPVAKLPKTRARARGQRSCS